MSSVTVTENNNKVTVNKTTNVVTVTSPGTVGPQGGAGTIESATASATTVAVNSSGISGTPTAAVTLGGTAEARTMAFAFGVPTGNSGVIDSIVTTGTDGIDVDSGGTMDSFASTIQLGINAQTLWNHILGANVTGATLTVSDGTNTSPIALEGTVTYSPVANETTVVENAGTITIGLVDNPTVSGNLTVSGDLTVSGSTTTVDTTVTISDAVVVNNAGSDVGIKVNSTSTGNIMQLQDGGSDVFVVADGGTTTATAFAGPLTGNASTATALATSRNIGGVAFDGATNINLPGVNTAGNQDTSGNSATATALQSARNIGGVSFDGTGDINLPGVNATGSQNTSGTAGTATNVTVADESGDTTCFPLFVTAATGGVSPKSGTNLTFNASTGVLTATGFAGPLTGAVTGNASTATLATTATTAIEVAVADESTDTTCFPLFVTSATGALLPKSGTNLTFNSNTGVLTTTGFVGPLTGAVTGNASTATALASGRTVGMTGDVVWSSPTFDGSSDVTAAATIQGQAINEAKLQVSNAPTNGQVLTARSGATGGMTWEENAAAAGEPAGTGIAMAIALG